MPNSLHYRFAESADIAETARLAAHSFPGATRPPEWWVEQLRDPLYGGGADTLFIGQRAGHTIAACQVHRLRQWIGGRALDTAGIGSVAISPAHRRQGLGADLITATLQAAHERGDVASLLYPFRTSFYQRLGYGRAGAVQQYVVPPSTLPDAPERHQIELLASGAARDQALVLYNEWARTQNGQLERGARVWRHLTDGADRMLAGWRSTAGALEGYALALFRTDLPLPQRYLEVDELVWTTARARRGLYAWLASLADQWPRLLLRALPSHRLGDWVSEPRLPYGTAPGWRLWEPEATLLAGPMFRLLNMQQAWDGRPVADVEHAGVCLEVTDTQLPHNSGTWCIDFDGGSTRVQRGGHADLTLRLGMATLSRIFIGTLPPSAAHEAGLLECDRPERLHQLDTALALSEPWTFDRF